MNRFGFRRPTGQNPLSTLLILVALLPQALQAQEPTPPGGELTSGSTPSKTQKVADLTSRYRFTERYTNQDDQVGPGKVGPCRVAIVEVLKDSVDSPQSAPKRTEATRQLIFTGRPAEIGPLGTAGSVTRTIEQFRVKPEDASKTMGARPLEGLSILVKPRLGEPPLVISLTQGRLLTEYEYDVTAHQIFVAQLASFLPTQVIRVGDTWRITRKAAQALLGDPTVQGDTLVGKLNEIRKDVDGPKMVASISITGKVTGQSGDTTVNAEILFTFQAETSATKSPTTKPFEISRTKEEVTEARGAITELRLARVSSGQIPGKERLRFQSNRELTLHRQLGLVAGAAAPPRLDKMPEQTEANAWLTHVDPAGRYSFHHPEDLLLPDRSQLAAEPNTTLLIRSRRDGRDMLQVEFAPKILTPEDLKKELADKYSTLKMEVIKGDETWLPEADWPKMRVHRIDAEVKVVEGKAVSTLGSPRIHFDGYLIQFGQSASILAVATTSRGGVSGYRQEVEKILKTIQLDPPRPAVK